MKLKKFLSDSDRRAIEAAVREAESRTSGEIVPTVVESSASYGWIAYRAAFAGWLAATLVAIWAHVYHPFMLEFRDTLLLQIGGLLLGWGISLLPFATRLLVSRAALAEEVDQAAHVSFVRHGLMNTRERTGVLIFVSLREHRVEILGDQGIHEKVGAAFWAQEVERIVAAIRDRRPAEGIVAAIRSIGTRLEEHFPRRADDKNELPDHLRTD